MNERDIAETLGDLERQVFESVRDRGPVNVREIVETLQEAGRPLAYTTVMTVLVRLWEKGYLLRQRDGRAYLYEARDSGEIAETVGVRVVKEALARFGEQAITGFVQSLTPAQRQTIIRLLREEAEDATS